MSFDGNRWIHFIWVVTALLPAPALAEQPSGQTQSAELIFLDYQATAECPNREIFLEQVRAYAPQIVLTTEQGASRLFKVRVEKTARQLRGKLEIRSADTTAQREVSADTCDEVVDALALATALAVDPSLFGGPAVEEPAQPSSLPKAVAPPPPAASPVQPANQHDVRPAPREKPTLPKKVSEVRPSWRLGAEALAIWGLLPRVAFGPGLSLESGLNEVDRWLPNLVLAVFYVGSGDRVKHSATMHFAAVAAEARACWPFADRARFRLGVCPVAEIGNLHSELLGQASANEGNGTWAALGLAGQVDVALGRSWSLQARSALLAHLVHQKVVIVAVEPNGQVEELVAHETTGTLAVLAAGLTYRF